VVAPVMREAMGVQVKPAGTLGSAAGKFSPLAAKRRRMTREGLFMRAWFVLIYGIRLWEHHYAQDVPMAVEGIYSMPHEVTEVRYARGEIARIGDRVDNDGSKCVVDDVVATSERMAFWGLNERGLMLKCKEAGLVFVPCSSIAWDAIVLESRAA
jgi:hypothetical protein